MKRKSLMGAILCLVLSSVSFAQSTGFGVKVGANYANLRSNISAKDYESIPGLHAGLFAAIGVSKVEIQPELLYSLQGSDSKDSGSGTVTETRSHYVNLPIMVKIFLVKKLSLQLGPQFGLLLSSKSTTDNLKTDIKDQYKSSSFDAVFGVGYDLMDKIDFALRYTVGMSDLRDESSASGVSEEIKNSVLQISVGINLK